MAVYTYGRLPGKRPRSRHETPTAEDLVDRVFARTAPDRLWVTDITEHPAREGKVYCAVVLDTFSRRVVGWSIDSAPSSTLATNALGMAIQNRRPSSGTLIHSDHGTQFTSWAFTAKRSGLLPSMGSIGDCFDNAVVESFWARMQVELLNRRRWRTRVELANAIFEHLEIFHNRHRRHSSLGMRTPIEFEKMHSRPSEADGSGAPIPWARRGHDWRWGERRAGPEGCRHRRGHGIGEPRGAGHRPARAAHSSFASLPSVVAEGRRVLANIERTANLFLTKTVYAMLLALAVGVLRLPFPFLPRHLTLVGSLTIGIPAFFLALAPNARRALPRFVGRALRFALPAGLMTAAATLAAYGLARTELHVTLAEARTVATVVLFWVGLLVLDMVAAPLRPARRGLILALAGAFVGVMAIAPLRSFFALSPPSIAELLATLGLGAIVVSVLRFLVPTAPGALAERERK